MREASKKILAYQRGPLILVCHQAGEIPEEFLLSISTDEKRYLQIITNNGAEGIYYDILQQIGAAGIAPAIHTRLVNVHNEPTTIHSQIDEVFLPLADEYNTRNYLLNEYAMLYKADIKSLIIKTRQRFGRAHVIILSILPRFYAGQQVRELTVLYGMNTAMESPEYLREWANTFHISHDDVSVLGVNYNCLLTESLYQQALEDTRALEHIPIELH